MVLIEEVAATPDAVGEKVKRSVPDTNDASAGDKEREQAFMRALNLSDDAQEMLAKAVALAKSDASTVSCTREGWWYESEERAAKHMQIGLERLQGVAKASGDGAAKAGDWEDALEHYFSAMEVSWQRQPGGGDELGTLHCNCSLCCLKLSREVEALEHAETAARMRPKWSKAHGRRAAALEAAGRLGEASDAYGLARALSQTSAEGADFAAAESRCAGRGDDGRVRCCAPPMPQHTTADVFVEGQHAMSDDDEDEEDEDVGEPLGEPIAFEPARASITLSHQSQNEMVNGHASAPIASELI